MKVFPAFRPRLSKSRSEMQAFIIEGEASEETADQDDSEMLRRCVNVKQSHHGLPLSGCDCTFGQHCQPMVLLCAHIPKKSNFPN